MSPIQSVSFWEAFRFWLKLGFISFGGPAGQIAILHQELVERRRWISERRFLHALNYCMVLPGPEAQQLVTYIGWLMHRTAGGVVAGVLFVLPSLLILILLSWIYIAWGQVPLIAGLFYGIKPAVVAIVVQAVHRIGSRTLKNPMLYAIAAASFVAIFAINLPFPWIVLMAALTGVSVSRWRPDWFKSSAGHGAALTAHKPALIDDNTPIPAHARYSQRGLFNVIAAGAVLWLLPMAIMIGMGGLNSVWAQIAWFFSKAAMLTFGGAYAVLPYVYQGAVDQFHWLTGTQMMDGLALGETTPGPLIMIVAFVGFIAAYTQAWLGPDQWFMAGALGAAIVTWFTFLPSFVFILAGGPLVESTHGDIKFTAPLTAITAAVVGVVLNLALFFGANVLWPKGWGGPVDMVSAALSVAALVALLRFKVNVIKVIAACGMLGLAYTLLSH